MLSFCILHLWCCIEIKNPIKSYYVGFSYANHKVSLHLSQIRSEITDQVDKRAAQLHSKYFMETLIPYNISLIVHR